MTSSSPPGEPPRGAGLALLTTLVQTIGTTIAARGQATSLDLLGYALLVVSGLALGGRHSARIPSAVVIAAATVAYHVLDYPSGPTFVAAIIAAWSAMKARRYRLVWVLAVLSYAAWVVLAGATLNQTVTLAAWVVGLGLITAPLSFFGRFLERIGVEQKRLREERRRRQASEERLRIAQELHDVLGHHLSLINVRAGVGRHLMDREPEQARIALDTIKQASAEALREVQSVLDALYPSGEAAPRAPAPTIERLHELTADAGLPVRTTIIGEPRPLPAEIDRAAYRIVQEALTNVRRHAGTSATATITIEYRQEELVVQVENDGDASEVTPEGNGINGMRERATTLGGSLTAQPLVDGGWRVHAKLPLPLPPSAS